jgi:protein ImuB
MIEERMVPRLPLAERYAERRFADPIGLLDDVLMTAHDLAIQLAIRLETEGLGGQAFHLFLYRVDHKVMALSVNSARLTRDPDHITKLFSNRSERLAGEYDAGFGIDMIRLAVSSVAGLDAAQLGAFSHQDMAEDLDQLNDRMSSRLGSLAVLRTQLVASHIPERAARLVPALVANNDPAGAGTRPALVRPLRLLPVPEPVAINAEVPHGLPALDDLAAGKLQDRKGIGARTAGGRMVAQRPKAASGAGRKARKGRETALYCRSAAA